MDEKVRLEASARFTGEGLPMSPRAATPAPTLSPAHVAERVARTIDGLFATVDGWRDRLHAHLEADAAPTAATLDPVVHSYAVPALAADGLITGSGFVAAPGLLSDAQWHLAWWLGGAGGIRRLATIDDPSNEQFRDYTTLEWWRYPARTGARHLTGPYVDYVCTDDYTVTITTPVVVGGRLLGVVGMDVLVDRLERELLPLLRANGAPMAIVNASGRIVTSTDARREPGSMLRLGRSLRRCSPRCAKRIRSASRLCSPTARRCWRAATRPSRWWSVSERGQRPSAPASVMATSVRWKFWNERDAVGPRWFWYRLPYGPEPYGFSVGEDRRKKHS